MKHLLKTHFGYDEFRPLQEEIINNVLENKDTFVLMPTGGGKSMCYQLPALKFEGLTLVISPLIALMKDQVDALKANGIAAAFINSSLPYQEINQIQRDAQAGKIKILYVAPERLAMTNFQLYLHELKISLIAIDEAHCISQWGHDFRPDYRNLRIFKVQFPDTPIIALTATATPKVRDDIISQLALKDPRIHVSSFDRPNLSLLVYRKRHAFEKLLKLLDKHKGEPAIIYCFSRKETEKIAANLKDEGLKALPYHAGLDHKTRKRTQELFIKDEVNIIVATIAFGMGIDKPDVRLVVHYVFPKSMEGYYQEVGRAGRDGLPSDCVLLYSAGDRRKHEFFLDNINDPQEKANVIKKLDEVMKYCEQSGCRRKFVLGYFGEEYNHENTKTQKHENNDVTGCGACDVCLGSGAVESFDATEISQKILSTVIRTGNRFGKGYIIKVLKGKTSPQILQNRHDGLSVFGIVNDFIDDELKHIISCLVDQNFLQVEKGLYPTLSVSASGAQWLNNREKLELPKFTRDSIEVEMRSSEREAIKYDMALFNKLRVLRKQIADNRGMPPFVIFGDISLQEMAKYFPVDTGNFAKINGVGEQKLADFGQDFMKIIDQHVKENSLTPLEVPDHSKRKRNQARRSIRNGGADYIGTKELVQQKVPLSDIAKRQGLTKDTIIKHIEKLMNAGEALDLDYLRPPEKYYNEIKSAFDECGLEWLKPVFEHLKEQYTYDEIKLVRLLMGANEKLETMS